MPSFKTTSPIKIGCLFAAAAMMSVPSYAEAQTFTQRGTRNGAIAGAIVGGLIGGRRDRPIAGAVVGGLVGGVAGRAVGQSKDARFFGGNQFYRQPSFQRQPAFFSPQPLHRGNIGPVYYGNGFYGNGFQQGSFHPVYRAPVRHW